MFISHEDILWCKTGNLRDREWSMEVCRRLMPEHVTTWDPTKEAVCSHPCSMLLSYLQQLPPHEKALKIGEKLTEIADAHGATISDLRWWDIEHHKRDLIVRVRRHDRVEAMCLLMWKKSENSSDQARITSFRSSSTYSWSFDRSAPGGWRFEMECEVFEHIKDTFARWLSSPLPPYPYTVASATAQGPT